MRGRLAMRRRLMMLLRGTLTTIVIGVVAVAASVALTDPDPASLLSRKRLRSFLPSIPTARRTAVPVASDAPIPLFSDNWIDDSGYSFATAFAGPITDPASLGQIRLSCVGRGHRGIAHFQDVLGRLPAGAPEAAVHAERLHLMI